MKGPEASCPPAPASRELAAHPGCQPSPGLRFPFKVFLYHPAGFTGLDDCYTAVDDHPEG